MSRRAQAARFGVERSWYPLDAMRLANTRVWVQTGRAECVAVVRRHPRRDVWWWYEVSPHGVETALDMWRRAALETPPMHAPRCWAPLISGVWPRPLPDPLPSPYGSLDSVAQDVPEAEALDAAACDDGWPYPGLALGCRTPPATMEECEARLMRGLRTEGSRAVTGLECRRRTICGDIPAELVKLVRKRCEAERWADGERTGEEYEAVRSAWTPTRRDLTDWDYALDWLLGVPADHRRRARQVMVLRAADPRFSWDQLANRMQISTSAARALYRRAIEGAFAWAARMDGTVSRRQSDG